MAAKKKKAERKKASSGEKVYNAGVAGSYAGGAASVVKAGKGKNPVKRAKSGANVKFNRFMSKNEVAADKEVKAMPGKFAKKGTKKSAKAAKAYSKARSAKTKVGKKVQTKRALSASSKAKSAYGKGSDLGKLTVGDVTKAGMKNAGKIAAGSKTYRSGAKGAAVGAAAEGGYLLYKKRTKGGKSITVKRNKRSKRKK